MTIGRRKILIGAGAAAVVSAGAVWAGLRGMGSMYAYEVAMAETRAALAANPHLSEFVRFATLAPSGHKTQAWRFRIGTDRIDVLPDFARRTPIVDPDDHHLFVGLGCAAENLVLAAAATGHVADAGLQGRVHAKLTIHLPEAAPDELVTGHLHHFAIEFRNWTRMTSETA